MFQLEILNLSSKVQREGEKFVKYDDHFLSYEARNYKKNGNRRGDLFSKYFQSYIVSAIKVNRTGRVFTINNDNRLRVKC